MGGLMRFTVGQWVQVGRTVEARYPTKMNKSGTDYQRSQRREMWVHEAGWPAVVVGATRIRLGTRIPGSYGGDPEWAEPPGFKVSRTVLVYLVRQGMLNRQHKCLPQHLTLIDTQELPWFYNPDAGGWRGTKEWDEEHDAAAVVKALGGACRFCKDSGYLQRWQGPPNARNQDGSKPCPACNPRGERV